jgi:hypothetical protein
MRFFLVLSDVKLLRLLGNGRFFLTPLFWLSGVMSQYYYEKDERFDNAVDPVIVWEVWRVTSMTVVKKTAGQT